MVLHIAIGRETLPAAKRAHERLNVSVDPQVDLQVRDQFEFFSTTIVSAFEKAALFFIQMYRFTCNEFIAIFEF